MIHICSDSRYQLHILAYRAQGVEVPMWIPLDQKPCSKVLFISENGTQNLLDFPRYVWHTHDSHNQNSNDLIYNLFLVTFSYTNIYRNPNNKRPLLHSFHQPHGIQHFTLFSFQVSKNFENSHFAHLW